MDNRNYGVNSYNPNAGATANFPVTNGENRNYVAGGKIFGGRLGDMGFRNYSIWRSGNSCPVRKLYQRMNSVHIAVKAERCYGRMRIKAALKELPIYCSIYL